MNTRTLIIAIVAVLGIGGASYALLTSKDVIPSCSLVTTLPTGEMQTGTTTSVTLTNGQSFGVSWDSTSAKTAFDVMGISIPLSGTATATPTQTTNYSYTFVNGSQKTTCSVMAIVNAEIMHAATTTPAVVKVGPATPVKTVKTVVVTYTPPPVVVVTPPSPPPAPIVVPGYGSLSVSLIPLLSGGNVRAGGVVPVSYLQVNNTGTTTVKINGFKIKENGSAPDVSIIGLQSVDEKGGSRGAVGGSEATTPIVNGAAVVPSTAVLAPGQLKLFTVKVQLSATAGQYAGTQIIITVTGLDATATVRGNFPIPGTTWTIIP